MGNYAYSFTVSVYYAVFNLPLAFIPGITLFPSNVYILANVDFVIPLIAHLIYWYILGSFFGVIKDEENVVRKYKYALIAVSLFLIFYVVFSIIAGVVWGGIIYLSR